MRPAKKRVTVTLDKALVQAGSKAVAAGRADSFSGWINEALSEHVAKERRSQALAEAIADYEAEHGVISSAELTAQARVDHARALVVRGGKRQRPRKRGRAA
jgi:Arc/MetJ-type ribon-helix-helix transcriptional regulator